MFESRAIHRVQRHVKSSLVVAKSRLELTNAGLGVKKHNLPENRNVLKDNAPITVFFRLVERKKSRKNKTTLIVRALSQ